MLCNNKLRGILYVYMRVRINVYTCVYLDVIYSAFGEKRARRGRRYSAAFVSQHPTLTQRASRAADAINLQHRRRSPLLLSPILIKLMFSDSSSPAHVGRQKSTNAPSACPGQRRNGRATRATSVCTAIELQNLTSFLRRLPRFPRAPCFARSLDSRTRFSRPPRGHRDIDRAPTFVRMRANRPTVRSLPASLAAASGAG